MKFDLKTLVNPVVVLSGCGTVRSRALGEAGAGHALSQAALLEKGALQLSQLLVQQVVGLVD
jgi:hypothetical protein